MLEAIFSRAVAGALEPFVENLSAEHVESLHPLGGRIVFKDLTLRPDLCLQLLKENIITGSSELAGLVSSLRVEHGKIGRVAVHVPWQREANSPVEPYTSALEIYDVHMLLKLQSQPSSTGLQELFEKLTMQSIELAVERELQSFRDTRTSLPDSSSLWKSKLSSWQWWLGVDDIIDNALRRVRVRVAGVHVRFEGERENASGSSRITAQERFACGITVKDADFVSSIGPTRVPVVDICKNLLGLFTSGTAPIMPNSGTDVQVQGHLNLDHMSAYYQREAPSFLHLSPNSKDDAFSRLIDAPERTRDHLLFIPLLEIDTFLDNTNRNTNSKQYKDNGPQPLNVNIRMSMSEGSSCRLNTAVFREVALIRSKVNGVVTALQRYVMSRV
jgi:hypothetical protein